jgi:ADP-ribose pyrophosphatase YjhB (NUDIX family)
MPIDEWVRKYYPTCKWPEEIPTMDQCYLCYKKQKLERKMKDQFCSYCGAEYAKLTWPRHCDKCQADTWRNPQPVVIALVPVKAPNGLGLVLTRRGIPPHVGELALPGGFMEFDETWQQTASRELREETGVEIPADQFMFFDLQSSTYNGKLLIFALAPIQELTSTVTQFKLNSEVQEIFVNFHECDLCFPLQTAALKKWFLFSKD